MRSSAGPDAWEPAGGSTGTWALREPGGAGVSAALLLPITLLQVSAQCALVSRPGGVPEWAGLRAGWRAEAG